MPALAKGKLDVTFHPNPVQRLFIESRAKADLFASRMGEGKSAALSWAAFYHTRHNPGAEWAMIRDTWENLRATTLKEFLYWFPDGVFGKYHHTNKEYTWNPDIAVGSVSFLGMDDPSDATKLQSRSLAGVGFDEVAPSTDTGGISELVFDLALSRLRQPNMKWYACKLAENNPDENHWTYQRFADPGTEGFEIWQSQMPENTKNLPPDYYTNLRRLWGHRPDIVRRFVDGKFGFQQQGRAVTPEWSDDLHLSHGLTPLRNQPLHILWDFGLNPTCIITQITPARRWNILDAVVGDDMGVEELMDAVVRPLLADRYRNFSWSHIGDPAGTQREQSSSKVSAVNMIRKAIGGTWRSGPKYWAERVEPTRAILRQTVQGAGLVQVDRTRAAPVWQALRGGWHYNVARSGVVSTEAIKNMHSHPGDAFAYGAAVLFPLTRLHNPPGRPGNGLPSRQRGTYFGAGRRVIVPPEARILGA